MHLQSYLKRAGGQILWKKAGPNYQRIANNWFCNICNRATFINFAAFVNPICVNIEKERWQNAPLSESSVHMKWLSISKTVFVLILSHGHDSWMITKSMRLLVQASEMRFLRRIKRVTLFNKVRSSEVRKSLNIEPLLFRFERSQLRRFAH